MVANNIKPRGEHFDTWDSNLSSIFLAAIELKAKVDLLDGHTCFEWPRAEVSFEPKMMTATNPLHEESDWKVQLALFPGLIRKRDSTSEGECEEAEVIFPATVILQ